VSVINKMLRDLDARQGAEHDKVTSPRTAQSAMAGTASVRASRSLAPEKRSITSSRWLLALLVVLTLAGVAWYASQTGWMFNKTSPLSQLTVAQPAPAPAPSVSPVPTTMPAPAPVVVNANVETLVLDKQQVLESPLPAPKVAVVPVVAPEPVKPQAAALSNRSVNAVTSNAPNNAPIQLLLRLENALRTVPTRLEPTASAASQLNPTRTLPIQAQSPQTSATTISAATPAPERSAGSAPSALSLRQLAVQETLAQAQSLWTSGARSAALDLMREAVAVSERAQSGLSPEAAASVLAPLVRELVPMELSEGRVSAALEVLTRLETALSGQSDLWAVRGNAAQRLSRHAESVRAYQMALKLRPGESRWMLGAAVSMAAQGQFTEAAELVESARAIGAVSPEILAYLRQAGVQLR
jgi:MSHA biogenesis protein MshN